jgi:chromosomal replication initiator protein
MIFVHDIQRATASHFGVPVEAMTGRRRIWEHSRPRQMAMCLATRLTNHSLVRIGHFFGGRDHTTVIHAMHQTEQRRRDPEIAKALREVTLTLLREAGR